MLAKSYQNLKDSNLQETNKNLLRKFGKHCIISKIMSYAQGFAQLRTASKEYDWQLPFGEIAKIWRAGCIIRAQFLQKNHRCL